jgi:uncharacterized protein YndB with AHSA1/START domain
MATRHQAPAARAPLSRERVLRTAVDIADSGGIESLSMRRLAKELGVEAMSLYHHVANKSDLLEAIVDLVAAEIWIPSPGDEWRSAMRRRAVSAREVFTRHPWALGLIESSRTPGLDRLRYLESVLACLRSAGFSTALAAHSFSTLDSFIYGFVVQERSLTFGAPEGLVETGEDILRDAPPDGFPSLRETIMEFTRTGAGFADDFEFGLELILDGLERAHMEETGMTGGTTYDMVLTRIFDAPVEAVWKAWTESDLVKRWWGPAGFTAPVAEMDVRVGGTSLVCMRAPAEFGGGDMYNIWTYSTVEPGARLEFVQRFSDEHRTPARSGGPRPAARDPGRGPPRPHVPRARRWKDRIHGHGVRLCLPGHRRDLPRRHGAVPRQAGRHPGLTSS